MTQRGVSLALALVSLALAVPRGASADDVGGKSIPVPRVFAGPMLHGNLELTLSDAIAMGLQNNLDVEVQRFEPLIAKQDIGVAWGAYDPSFVAEYGYESIKDPNAFALNPIAVSVNRRMDGFGALQGLVPYLNARFDVRFSGSRSTTNSTIQALSPELRSEFSASATFPLLKDLIWNQEWTRVKTSGVQYGITAENFRTNVMDVVQDIEEAYWALIANEEQDRVAAKSLETAKALLGQTTTQYEVGVVSKVDVVEAEAGVAERRVLKIRTDNAYRNQQDVLIDLILGAGLRADSTLEIVPTDAPEDFIAYDIQPEEAVRVAFQHRPELAAAEQEIERNMLNLKFARNQRLPKLDAQLTYGNRGLGGDQNSSLINPATGDPVPPGSIASSTFGDSVRDFFTSDANDQFSARGLFSIPIPNRSARHTVSRSELELRRAVTRKRRLEQNIILQVRRAIRNLDSAQEGIVAAEEAREAAEEQLRAERIRLEYGESTPFDVLLREESYVRTESAKIDALQVYRNSVTDLDRFQGTILRNNNVKIDEVGQLR